LVEAAVEIGLDSFTLAEVAARVGVGESTVYNYVPARELLFAQAAATVFAELDIDAEADGWPGYVEVIAQRAFDLAARHPGLRDYVFAGPYEPSTVATFEALIERVRGWLPDVPEHVVFVVVSRPILLGLGYLGDPVFEPLVPWLRGALLRGLETMLAEGSLPPAPAVSWRSKLRTTGGDPPS
jgi:AcrR family transcriptional regulator